MFQTHLLLMRWRTQAWLLIVAVRVLRLIEECKKRVVLALRDRIIFVAVTLGTAHRNAHPDLHGRIHAILHRLYTKLLVVRTTLIVGHRVAMKCRREQLF